MESPQGFLAELEARLLEAKAKRNYRDPESFASKSAAKGLGPYTDFSSNDYLGLSQDPRVIAAAEMALRLWGTGSAASRLLSGNLKVHQDLENALCDLKGEEASLVFSSGYLANLGALQTFAGQKDVILLDRFAHASLIDGARLSGATLRVFSHNDPEDLDSALKRSSGFRRRWVVTESYFSMDGDLAPLEDLARVCRKRGARWMVDEAHATGVLGADGSGLVGALKKDERPDLTLGTLSKALGSVGGFVSGRSEIRDSMINFCRPYIFTTAPSPAASAAAMAAVRELQRTPDLRQRALQNAEFLRRELRSQGWDLLRSVGPILPVLIGEPSETMRLKKALMRAGFFVSAIRQPTVPKGTDRLRISVSASHSVVQLSRLAEALKKLRKKKR